MGNPLSYKGRTLTWQGRRLISYGIENKKATYSYDFNNVRTSKIATDGTTSITSKYIYDGNNLIAEQRTVKGPDKDKSVWLYYIYGVDGIAGFNYNGVTYLYRKNIQGDITHIYRKDGNKDLVEVAHYAYDAWGNTEILSETDKIGSLNPFRYRGYYFDIETKLYYLISRYYDPETCRFISADGIEYLDPETLGGLNLYAYCCNNPVMAVDPLGTWDWGKFWKKVGALFVTAVATIGAIALTVATFGATTGLAICAVGFGIGFVGSIISQSIAGEEVNLWKATFDGLWGIVGIAGAASGIGVIGSVIAGGLTGAAQSYMSDMVFNNGIVNYKNLLYSTIGGAIGGLFAGAGAKSTIKAVQSTYQIFKNTVANGTGRYIGRAAAALSKNAFKLLQSAGLYFYGVIIGQSIVLGGTT